MPTKRRIGDGAPFRDGIPDFKYDISYPDSLEIEIKELRTKVDNWKEIVIPLYKFLTWEKQWCPLAIIGVNTAVFMFLWLSETSLLTIFSIIGLIVTLCDYLVPTIIASLIKPGRWTSEKETMLEGILGDVVLYSTQLEVNCLTYYQMRQTNPKMYFALTSMSLASLAWIGNSFNNLFLIYLATTFMLLYPGIEHNGFNHKFKELTTKFLKDYVNPRFENPKEK